MQLRRGGLRGKTGTCHVQKKTKLSTFRKLFDANRRAGKDVSSRIKIAGVTGQE